VIPLRKEHPPQTLRDHVQRLVREHRYEEALDVLLDARSRKPHDESISRSIRLVKERLMRTYIERIGNLDRVPRATLGGIHPSSLDADTQETLQLVDGICSVDDILLASRLGQFRTLRTLLRLAETGLLVWSGGVDDGLPSARADAVVSRVLADNSSLRRTAEIPRVDPPVEIRFVRSEPVVAPLPPLPPPPPPREPEPIPPPPIPVAASVHDTEQIYDGAPDPYTELFAEATRAYLRRDYARAEELFAECVAQRPTDNRAHYNLDSLRRRRRSKPTL